jgi:D-galacturonate reductase
MDAMPSHPVAADSKAAENVPAKGQTKPLNVLMVGTGEYTTGFVGGGASGSDKKVGVVGLTMFDLRRRGKVGKLSMVGTSGTKYPAIRTSPHFRLTLYSS